MIAFTHSKYRSSLCYLHVLACKSWRVSVKFKGTGSFVGEVRAGGYRSHGGPALPQNLPFCGTVIILVSMFVIYLEY